MEEVWKSITVEGLEHYFVSDQGRVKNKDGLILKPKPNNVSGRERQYYKWAYEE